MHYLIVEHNFILATKASFSSIRNISDFLSGFSYFNSLLFR